MKVDKRFVALLILLELLIVVGVFVVPGIMQKAQIEKVRETREKRVADMKVLVSLCRESTNINNTRDLFAAVEQQKIKLNSPIPIDPSKPCYHLVNKFDGVNLPNILILETNVNDNTIYGALMGGSVIAGRANPDGRGFSIIGK